MQRSIHRPIKVASAQSPVAKIALSVACCISSLLELCLYLLSNYLDGNSIACGTRTPLSYTCKTSSVRQNNIIKSYKSKIIRRKQIINWNPTLVKKLSFLNSHQFPFYGQIGHLQMSVSTIPFLHCSYISTGTYLPITLSTL